MISIEALLERFGPALEVQGYGKCLVILGSEFDPDWEAELDDQGFTVLFETWNNHPMTVVPLKVLVNEVKNVDKAKLWSNVEDDLLVSLWNAVPQLSVSEIASKFRARFPSRSESGVANRIQHLQQKNKWIKPRFIIHKNSEASKEAKKSPETSPLETEKAPAAAEPKPKLNGEFAEKCNLPIDCVDCDITECPGRKSERLQKPDLELALGNLTIETKRQIDQLTEICNLQREAISEFREDFEAYAKMQSEIIEAHREDLKVLTAKCARLQKEVAGHKHAVTGEAMLPLEALP